MRVLFATAELAPLVRVGGLAEAAGGLVRALRASGLEVDVVVPDYFGTRLADEETRAISVPPWVGPSTARTGMLDGFGEITLVDVAHIRRPHPYMDGALGWADNDKRFIGFSAVCAELAQEQGADILHANDWHTGAALGFVDPSIRTVFSIHNLAYQGEAHIGWVDVFDERGSAFNRHGSCNPMAGALTLADRIVAVSPTYAREILDDVNGAGLTDILHERAGQGALIGILNGIDTTEWNPSTDANLERPYGVRDFRVANPAAKAACRAALRSRLALPERAGPLLSMVTRLVEQKGVDLAAALVPYLDSVDGQLALLGSGDPAMAADLHGLADRSPERFAFHVGYDLALSHQMFGGADLYLMPSRFEPCGLAQMQAMAYGAIPIVTDVGGLHDTVVDADADTAATAANGIVARAVDAGGLVDALHRGARVWQDRRRRLNLIRTGMRTDWSWESPALQYLALYEHVVSETA